jgi:hypothetical protein
MAAIAVVGSASAQPGGCPPAMTSEGVRLTVKQRPDNRLIMDASIQLAVAAPVYLEYGNGQAGWLRTPTTPAAASHELPIVRLRPTTSYQARAFALDEAGCPTQVISANFITPSFPDFGTYTIESFGAFSFPLTFMDHKATVLGDRDARILALDAENQPVWYYEVPPEIARISGREVVALRRLRNGNFIYNARNYGLEVISPDGRPLQRLRFTDGPAARISHDLLELPDGRILFFGQEVRTVDDTANGGSPDQRIRADTLHVVDLATGVEQLVWNPFEHLDPTIRPVHWLRMREAQDGGEDILDWTHANSLDFDPQGNIVVSHRQMDQVIVLSSDFSRVLWTLGGPNGDFTIPDPYDRFYGQHTASVLDNGNVLVFDNGNYRPEGDYSRGLELQLDRSTMTARRVWEFRHEPDIYADRIGNALRLPNGNTLVNFGFPVGPSDPVVLSEVRPDGTVAAEVAMAERSRRTTRYRAYPYWTIAGEQQVEPTRIQGM